MTNLSKEIFYISTVNLNLEGLSQAEKLKHLFNITKDKLYILEKHGKSTLVLKFERGKKSTHIKFARQYNYNELIPNQLKADLMLADILKRNLIQDKIEIISSPDFRTLSVTNFEPDFSGVFFIIKEDPKKRKLDKKLKKLIKDTLTKEKIISLNERM